MSNSVRPQGSRRSAQVISRSSSSRRSIAWRAGSIASMTAAGILHTSTKQSKGRSASSTTSSPQTVAPRGITPCSFSRSVVYCVLVFAATQTASAAILRGRLQRRGANGAIYPASGIAFMVYNQALGRSAPTYTGADGMYYPTIPAGGYYLEVWTSRDPRVPPTTYPIRVVEPNTDIPPIFVP